MWQTKSSRWSSPLSFLSSWWPPRMERPQMASVLSRISSPTKLVLIPLQDSLKVAWTMSQYILGGQQPSIVRQVQEIVLSSLLCVYSFINCFHLVLYFMLCWTPTEVWHDKLLKKKDRWQIKQWIFLTNSYISVKLLQSIIISMNKYWFEISRHKWWASVVYKFKISHLLWHLGLAHHSTLA